MAAFSFGVMATSIAGRLLTSGLQRVGTLTFQKAMRISRIEHTLKGIPLRNPQVKSASDDFITLIGNRYGEYTEQLSKFLEELERSGLITAMVENALVDRKSEEVRKAFVLLHARVINPNEDDATSLYEKMMVSFTITFRELSKDKNTHAVLQLISRNVASRFDQVDSALQALNKQLPRVQHSSVQGMQPALLKLVRGLQAVTKQVRIETNKGARSVDISKIYIPPKLKYRDTAKNADLISNAVSVVRAKRQRLDASELVEWRVDPTSLNTIGYGDLKLSFSRVVILGDPGGGKSTICQNLCFDLAKQAAGALVAAHKPSAQLQKFPIRVVLRAFEKARTVNTQLSLFDFIIRDLMNHVSLDFEELREAVLYLLTTGAAVLAFDGLDEILATAQRREFVDLVLSFCNQYPLCPVVVTSRLVGYDSAPLTGEFEELVLERFDENEILNYLTKFFKVVGERTEAESSQYAQDFLRQTASNASDLRANPLMLGLGSVLNRDSI
ncbi:NACHT domain-containing protein [Bradyrhizobium diazoefficiens]|nr:NACHT domain-containing protein [Bradyrhizobium diazoefficiens]MBR0968897.1 NACHT domain-containing protein [Bradyrhizobium diazoefficiens]MBR0982253.1 NACHT domain-containing protein [Bradyrhizobium diazoefficiens]MBR1011689.1 NACHT domain-containing protein [Bradyrhizobium diazoefficiens]MBR1018163.1 NACHT domain-containing protein [Bradyrhizobium diazoefficiens]MBR1050565.1 NACHT domain-containing protein [Bradyrhizobium diazoefficiens]